MARFRRSIRMRNLPKPSIGNNPPSIAHNPDPALSGAKIGAKISNPRTRKERVMTKNSIACIAAVAALIFRDECLVARRHEPQLAGFRQRR